MSPSEIQTWLDAVPFAPAMLTLASGNVVEVKQREGVSITGLSLSVMQPSISGKLRLRLISIPNIAMLEPIPPSIGGRISPEVDDD